MRALEWLDNNWLALYGSIVGSIALVLTYTQHRYAVRRDRVAISIQMSPPRDIVVLTDAGEKVDLHSRIVEVIVRNVGLTATGLEEVGFEFPDGRTLQAKDEDTHRVGAISFTTFQLGPSAMLRILEPRTSVKFEIRISRSEATPTRAYAVDSSGQRWSNA